MRESGMARMGGAGDYRSEQFRTRVVTVLLALVSISIVAAGIIPAFTPNRGEPEKQRVLQATYVQQPDESTAQFRTRFVRQIVVACEVADVLEVELVDNEGTTTYTQDCNPPS